MSDSRKPTDGELFRKYRPGVGLPSEPEPKKERPWRGKSLTGDNAALLSLSKRTLSDEQALEFVQWLARWLSQPHGLAGHPGRSETDAALRRLLYKMSPGEATFHRERLTRENAERSRRAREQALAAARQEAIGGGAWCGVQVVRDDDDAPEARPLSPPPRQPVAALQPGLEVRRLVSYLAAGVPRADAIRIVTLIARDLRLQPPAGLETDFSAAATDFLAAHVPGARARAFLDELQGRALRGDAWVRSDAGGSRHGQPVASSDAVKQHHGDPRAYESWTEEEEQALRTFHAQGLSRQDIATKLGRQVGGVQSRLRRLGLVGMVLMAASALDAVAAASSLTSA